MITFSKPSKNDLEAIRQILKQWTDAEEVEKYLSRIETEINGQTEYAMNFWVALYNDQVIGVCGLALPMPNVLSYAKTSVPGEIKILYLDNAYRGKGVGQQTLSFLEKEALRQGYKELFVRSAERYKNTGHGFYEKMGYKILGKTENNMSIFNKVI